MIITIDGPSGSGKSTISKLLGNKLSFAYLNSGAFYRAVTYLALQYNHLDNETLPTPLLTEYCEVIIPSMIWDNDILTVTINDESIQLQDELFTREVDEVVAQVSCIEPIRKSITNRIRKLCTSNWIVEGRDAGSQIFPHAECKFYLDASLDVRVQRRSKQYQDTTHTTTTISQLSTDMNSRDTIDMNKGIYSLKKNNNFTYIDTALYSIDEILKKVYTIVNNYLQNKK